MTATGTRGTGSSASPRHGRQPGQREEQHVMGFPASWFDDVNVDALVWLVHPVRQYRRWARRRRRILTSPAKTER